MKGSHFHTDTEQLAEAANLVTQVCATSGTRFLFDEPRQAAAANGVAAAIDDHADGAMFDWLLDMFAYQGISDSVASGYAAARSTVGRRQIDGGLSRAPCPRLRAHWTFEGCGYRKGQWECGEPDHREACPLPSHDLRNGRLNQTGYSLRLFMRDVCADDFVGWIDQRLADEAGRERPQRSERLGHALVEPMLGVFGVSHKVLNMALSSLLLAPGPERPLWREAGTGMVVIDTLLHNWLHRTGLLRGSDSDHPYGSRCYAPGGCESLVRRLASHIDARAFNAEYPKNFPRFVQHAIWAFCAQSEQNICNGLAIDDRYPCAVEGCPLVGLCDRVPLKPQPGG